MTCHFNPRSPCGLRLLAFSKLQFWQPISIHAAHAGCDQPLCAYTPLLLWFQSTQPMRAATYPTHVPSYMVNISIHAAHAGCDSICFASSPAHSISIHAAHAGCDNRGFILVNPSTNFNPRSPCGLRQNLFNNLPLDIRISIHAAHAGCDFCLSSYWC